MALEYYDKLTAVENVTVMALHEKQQRLLEELRGVDAAVNAQIVSVAERQKLPPDRYQVTQKENGDGALYLVRVIPEQPTANDATPAAREAAAKPQAAPSKKKKGQRPPMSVDEAEPLPPTEEAVAPAA